MSRSPGEIIQRDELCRFDLHSFRKIADCRAREPGGVRLNEDVTRHSVTSAMPRYVGSLDRACFVCLIAFRHIGHFGFVARLNKCKGCATRGTTRRRIYGHHVKRDAHWFRVRDIPLPAWLELTVVPYEEVASDDGWNHIRRSPVRLRAGEGTPGAPAAFPARARTTKIEVPIARILNWMTDKGRDAMARGELLKRDQTIEAACASTGLNCSRQAARSAWESLPSEMRRGQNKLSKIGR